MPSALWNTLSGNQQSVNTESSDLRDRKVAVSLSAQ